MTLDTATRIIVKLAWRGVMDEKLCETPNLIDIRDAQMDAIVIAEKALKEVHHARQK